MNMRNLLQMTLYQIYGKHQNLSTSFAACSTQEINLLGLLKSRKRSKL